MERLILLRHGKAEAGASSGDDFDRALTERGRRDSVLVSQTLAQAGFSPDLVLVSSAARARQTWEATAPAFPQAKAVFVKDLYNAAPETILAQAQASGRDAGTVMVVAHNPGLHQLALTLARGGSAAERARLDAGFPTSAAAAFDLDAHGFWLFTPKALGGGA